MLTASVVDSPARTFQHPAKVQELKVNEADCGLNLLGSLAKYDLDTCSWKIPLCLFQGDWGLFSGIWPRWGTLRNGECWERQPLAQTTSVTGYGLLQVYPTPTAHNAKEGAYPAEYTRETPSLATHVGGKIHPHFTEWMMGWPLGWTDLKPLAMDKFLLWLQQHGKCF